MKILVENSGYGLRNMGDVLMLRVAVSRLREMWPDSEIYVVTNAPSRLAEYCKGCMPVAPVDRWPWMCLPRSVARHLPSGGRLGKIPDTIEAFLLWSSTFVIPDSIKSTPIVYGRTTNTLIDLIRSCDLVVATGGGYFCDHFRKHANRILTTLSIALAHHVPCALLGQGLGPLSDSTTLRRMKEIFPRLAIVTLREGRWSIPLLRRLREHDNCMVTGDDTIEFAYHHRCPNIGTLLGVNLRLTHYSGITQKELETCADAIRTVTQERQLSIVRLPSSFVSKKRTGVLSDEHALDLLLSGIDVPEFNSDAEESPDDLINRIGKCRVVVTGSYHVGVFALAQGVPVVGLARTQYYVNKFEGLSAQFPGGCFTARLDKSGDQRKLIEGEIGRFSQSDPGLRESLLDAARDQMSRTRRAYEMLKEIRPRKEEVALAQ